jgi:hypothetical protein
VKRSIGLFCIVLCLVGALPAAAAGKPAANTARRGAPPPGDYVCYLMTWSGGIGGTIQRQHKGLLKLLPGSAYQFQNGGQKGSYSYDESTGKLRFDGGDFGNGNATGTFIPRGKVSQIDLDFSTKTPMKWNCGHNN